MHDEPVFAALRDGVRRLAVEVGHNPTRLPELRCWRLDAPRGPSPSHSDGVSLALIVQGRKEVYVEGKTFAYDPGSYLVITGELDFSSRVVRASAAEPYLSLKVDLPPDLVAQTLVELADARVAEAAEPDAPAYVSPIDPPLASAVYRYVSAVDDDAERRVLAPLFLREIVFRLLRSDSAAALRRSAQRDGGAAIREAMAFIRAHAEERLTVERIAKRVAMSPSHFAHRFREVARVSPIRYVKHVRLERARVMLLHGARASEVADAVGYGSASHFTRDFKESFGDSPGRYAARFRESDSQDRVIEPQASP